MNRSLLLITALLLSACASDGTAENRRAERAAERLAEFDRTGEMTTCLSVRRIDSITALDEYNFLVRVGVNQYYLNEVSRCSGADDSFNRIQYELSNSLLCRNQIIRIVDNSANITVGSCGLGSFERLTKKVEEADE